MNKIQKFISVTLLCFSVNSLAVELTPLYGLRGGGDFIDDTTGKKRTVVSSNIYGLIIGFPYEYGKTLEVYYSHQSSDIKSVSITAPSPSATADIPLTIDYLHFGGTAPISNEKQFKTFVSGGLGFTYLSPDFTNAQSDLRASFSIGVGLKWPVTEHVAFRLETRGLATLYNNNSAIFCNGGCDIKVSGNLLFQGELFAGLAVKF